MLRALLFRGLAGTGRAGCCTRSDDAALRDGAGFPMGPLELTDLLVRTSILLSPVRCLTLSGRTSFFTFAGATGTGDWWTVGQKSGLGVYDWRAEREAVVGLER